MDGLRGACVSQVLPGVGRRTRLSAVEMFDVRAEIERLRDRVYELEQQVAWLMQQAGREGASTTLDEAVRSVLETHGYIPAVKLYRDRTGAGLAEAKQYVDKLRRTDPYVSEKSSVEGSAAGEPGGGPVGD